MLAPGTPTTVSSVSFLQVVWMRGAMSIEDACTFWHALVAKELAEEIDTWLQACALPKLPSARGVIAPYVIRHVLLAIANFLFCHGTLLVDVMFSATNFRCGLFREADSSTTMVIQACWLSILRPLCSICLCKY